MTIQYPEEKTPVYPRFRGRHKLHKFEDTGLEKCVGCSLCAAACPADCIRVVAAENIPGERVSAGERYAAVYEINLSRCIFCGYCEIACPFDAITMGHDYEMADYDRDDLIFTKEMLLAESLERTPLEGGRVDGSGALLRRRHRRPRRRDGRSRDAQPLLRRARADRPPLLARRPLPAAGRGLRRRRPGRRLRRRGDGPLRIRRRLRRRRRRVGLGADPGPALPRPAARRRPVRRALDGGARLLADRARHRRPRRQRRLRQPRRDRPPAPGKFLLPFEASSILLLLAAVGAIVLAGTRRGDSPEGRGTAREHRVVHRPLRPCSSPSARSGS